MSDKERVYTQSEVDALLHQAQNYIRGRCRVCGMKPGEHRMYCRLYVGPLTHQWYFRGLNPTFGGYDYECSCGRHTRIFDEPLPPCPDAEKAHREASA